MFIFEWSMPAIAPAGFAPGGAPFAPAAGAPMFIFEWSIPTIAAAGGGLTGSAGTAARQVKSSACAAATARCSSAIVSSNATGVVARRAISIRVLADSTMASAFCAPFAQASFCAGAGVGDDSNVPRAGLERRPRSTL